MYAPPRNPSSSVWKDAVVLITGVCGTVGRELLVQLVRREPAEIIGIDNNESELFFLAEEYADDEPVRFCLGDLRHMGSLLERTRGVDIILHAGAYKHVILCEQSPRDAVQTNILGTQNVIEAATANGVKRVLFTSSDKAVNPTSVMGTSKLMGERLISAANAQRRKDGPIFASTRFGNVLGSRGSVIPLFRRQIARGGPVTLTDERMTRFIMTLSKAAELVIDSVGLAEGGEVFVTKMPAMRISDLAAVMIQELAPTFNFEPESVAIQVIGSKPGEKLYEELLNEEETRRSVELDDFFAVLPALESLYRKIEYGYCGERPIGVAKPYNSAVEASMSPEQLRDYLRRSKLLEGGM